MSNEKDEYTRLVPLPSNYDDGFIEAALMMTDHDAREIDARLRRSSHEIHQPATVNGEPVRIELEDGTSYTPPPMLRVTYERGA